MGATNCPETPRQRMIGMMYLVLTAMLALNVSKEILNAFVTVNDTMEKTNENFAMKMNSTYESFAKAAEQEAEKAGPAYKKAVQVRQISKELVDYVNNIKDELYAKVDGMPLEEVKKQGKSLEHLEAKDNYDKPYEYFIGQKEDQKAYEMSRKFADYKEQLIAIVGDKDFNKEHAILQSGLRTDQSGKDKDGKPLSWEKFNFDGTVAAACFTLLNKNIGEIRNIEYETVNFLFGSIDAASYKFDNVSAKVIPNSRIVFSGDKYEADIIVAAYDSRQNPTVYWGSGKDTATEAMVSTLTAVEGENGIVHLAIPTSAVGDQKFAGLIKLRDPSSGADVFYSFKSSYSVTRPSAAVAAEKMNVFYAGIPNPVAIAAPVAPERLRINWGGASATSAGGGGKYEVNCPASLVGRDVTISVSAEISQGRTQNMGSTVFRVKAVPEPNVFVGGNLTTGKYPKDIILANPFVAARMGSDFNYQLNWQVLSYVVTVVRNGVEGAPITVNGAQFNDQVRSQIQGASSNTLVEFANIKIRSIAGDRTIQRPIVIRIR